MRKILIIFIFLFLLSGCSEKPHKIKLEVLGEINKADIKFSVNELDQVIDYAQLPWTYSFSAESDDYIFIMANSSYSTGGVEKQLTVRIYDNDEIKAKNTVFRSFPSIYTYYTVEKITSFMGL